jgi:NitT/TauT family transport system substrate-binding protein
MGGCQDKQQVNEIRVSTNPWVGFTPFIYAQEKGWLKESKFKFIWVVGLAENVTLYEKGLSRGFTATQYEYFNFKNKEHIKPYFLIDRSKGADIILSNKNIEELKNTKEKIVCYFEINSVNRDIFKAFIAAHSLNEARFVFHNSDQTSISVMKASEAPTILISYEPYATAISKNGFTKISSTKELSNIEVIDAIFLDERVVDGNEKELAHLKQMFDKAVLSLKKDPKEFYNTVKGYLENQTYEQFVISLDGIEWLNNKPNQEVINYLKKQNIPTDKLAI